MFELTPSPAPHDEAGHAFWPTPRWVTLALLEAHHVWTPWVWEPCAGEGAVAEVLGELGYHVAATELRPECDTELRRVLHPSSAHVVATGIDALKHEAEDFVGRDEPYSIITNPPYDPAGLMLHLTRHFVRSAAQLTALLLPTSFLHSETRAPFNLQHPPNAIYPLARRPSCREDRSGGGKRDLSWFVWDRRWSSGRQLISVIP